MKYIYCPNCRTKRCSNGYKVQLNVGVICTGCEKVIFPVSIANQPDLKKIDKPVNQTYHHHNSAAPFNYEMG